MAIRGKSSSIAKGAAFRYRAHPQARHSIPRLTGPHRVRPSSARRASAALLESARPGRAVSAAPASGCRATGESRALGRDDQARTGAAAADGSAAEIANRALPPGSGHIYKVRFFHQNAKWKQKKQKREKRQKALFCLFCPFCLFCFLIAFRHET